MEREQFWDLFRFVRKFYSLGGGHQFSNSAYDAGLENSSLLVIRMQERTTGRVTSKSLTITEVTCIGCKFLSLLLFFLE